MLLFYRYRLFANESAILQVGVILRQRADLSHVDELKRRTCPQGGSARLSGDSGVLKINFGDFQPAQREQLIASPSDH